MDETNLLKSLQDLRLTYQEAAVNPHTEKRKWHSGVAYGVILASRYIEHYGHKKSTLLLYSQLENLRKTWIRQAADQSILGVEMDYVRGTIHGIEMAVMYLSRHEVIDRVAS